MLLGEMLLLRLQLLPAEMTERESCSQLFFALKPCQKFRRAEGRRSAALFKCRGFHWSRGTIVPLFLRHALPASAWTPQGTFTTWKSLHKVQRFQGSCVFAHSGGILDGNSEFWVPTHCSIFGC